MKKQLVLVVGHIVSLLAICLIYGSAWIESIAGRAVLFKSEPFV